MDQLHDEWIACSSSTKARKLQRGRPALVSAIAIGNEVYLGSSIKLNKPNLLLTHNNQKLVQALQVCLLSYPEKRGQRIEHDELHRTGASCGEITASSMYLIRHGELPWDHQAPNGQKPIVISYGRTGTVTAPTIQVVAPCTSPVEDKNIGCEQFAGMLNWATAETIEETDIKEVNEAPTDYHPTSLRQGWSIEQTAAIDPIRTS
jgi:hypothetical protein